MVNFGLPDYDAHREWIRKAREEGKKSWEEITFGLTVDENGLEAFLRRKTVEDFWKSVTCDEWKELVKRQKEAEDQTKEIYYLSGQAIIYESGEENESRVSTDPNSAWQLYRKKLLCDGFKEETVNLIQETTRKILKKLSNDTSMIRPVKGLVIGNVQSGKTANMAALMAMAADCGWNMFIILSGTIDNLRQQTQNRLLNDLNRPGNLNWFGLEHLSKKPAYGQRAQDLHFEDGSKQRYFTVCLKNPGRLRGLIQWLQSDSNKQRQMRILVIDDEADQAGINTANIASTTIKTINKLIRDLVNGRNEKSKEIEAKYRAMNYIGYTATPYANVLNEAGEDSLYPHNFISTLSISKEYFGPQQIFGLEGGEGGEYDYDGLDIVNTIDESDLEVIKDIHEGESHYIPVTLENAICWFMCGVACMRIWDYKKPISMLIHTSQKTKHHANIAEVVKNWISSRKFEDIIDKCEDVWRQETERFSLKKFREQYPDYARRDEEINQYPNFENVKKQIKILLDHEITNIPLDDDKELTYHNGIHMCVDNCKNNGINDDGMYVRLAYPTSDNMPSPAPAFIIIGGATLSRGLTIEGLLSTFFLRSVSQADTLMQMGRWFGYRKGYELLPRLWITTKTKEQFKFLSALDQELRDEIHEMETLGKSPAQYGPRVKNTPKASFIRITAKNRMQSAKSTDMDFSGSFNQTYLFDNNKEILKNNINVVEKFICSLGSPEIIKDCNRSHANNSVIWRNVGFNKVKELLKNYVFQPRLSVFNDIDSVIAWIDKITSDGKLESWNIVLAGKASAENTVWNSPVGPVNKVKRTRKRTKNEADTVINIGVLRDPKDIIADVDLEGKSDDIKEKVNNFKSKYAKEIRNLAGLDITPQLIIYMIDKNSATDSESRMPLGAVEDIVGICMNIPGGKRGTDYTATVSIHMKNDIFDDEGDLEGTNED